MVLFAVKKILSLIMQEEIRKPSLVINDKLEENNRMEKTRDFFKKIRDAKVTFHAKMGTIKDRDGMDLTEVKDQSWKHNTTRLQTIL